MPNICHKVFINFFILIIQQWRYLQESGQLQHVRSSLCLDTAIGQLAMQTCNPHTYTQRWKWKFPGASSASQDSQVQKNILKASSSPSKTLIRRIESFIFVCVDSNFVVQIEQQLPDSYIVINMQLQITVTHKHQYVNNKFAH